MVVKFICFHNLISVQFYFTPYLFVLCNWQQNKMRVILEVHQRILVDPKAFIWLFQIVES
jgi:hypothetical protein